MPLRDRADIRTKLTEEGYMCQLSSGRWVPYKLPPSYVPRELYEAQKQKLVEPQTSLPSAPSHPNDDDDDLVPRSPCVPLYTYTMPSTPPQSALLKARDKIPPSDLLGKVGLHCYNLQNGTNLPLRNVFIMRTAIDTGIVTTSSDFQARVRYNEIEKERCSTMITTLSRFMPPKTPGTTSEVEGDLCAAFDRLSVDDFFKDEMPHWVPRDATHNLQYYEMEDSEVEEYKEWLHLYAEIAYFTTLGRFLEELRWAQPFELTKVIVQTREDVESKKKAKAENAIFYIVFKTRAVGREYNAIIRRTMDGTPEHMSLEVKCFKKM